MKENTLPIHDLFIRKLDTLDEDGQIRMPILSFEHHLLRRFGFAESILVKPEYRTKMKVREVADEIWASLSGKVRFHWWDLRSGSPSHENRYEIFIEEPHLVLVPFGVAFGVQTYDEPVHLIRFSTHPEDIHDGDHVVPWEMD